jgi:hypothetical protein
MPKLNNLLDLHVAEPRSELGPGARAMVTASGLFDTARDPRRLLGSAARALAIEPGPMCLVSLTCGPHNDLRPVFVAHARPAAWRWLRHSFPRRRQPQPPPADAFSREVQRTGGSLHIDVTHPRLLRLWLPAEYARCAQRIGVTDIFATALVDRGRVLGTLLLWRERGQPAFVAADEEYVIALAARLAFALRRLSRSDQSLDVTA